VFEVVLDQQVGAEVVGGVAPDAMHVVGVVEFGEGGRSLDPEAVRLVDGRATGSQASCLVIGRIMRSGGRP